MVFSCVAVAKLGALPTSKERRLRYGFGGGGVASATGGCVGGLALCSAHAATRAIINEVQASGNRAARRFVNNSFWARATIPARPQRARIVAAPRAAAAAPGRPPWPPA